MTRSQSIFLFVTALSGLAATGCPAGGVGDPCIPEDEYTATFSGFGIGEANVESRSFQCETRVCIVNHFQGRVSCPYGYDGDPNSTTPNTSHGQCLIPSSPDPVTAVVDAQLLARRADSTVYCSCRCDGDDKSAKYCSCPNGYSCTPLVPNLGFGKTNLAGKYCLKNGTEYTSTATGGPTCSDKAGSCDTPGAKPNMNPGH